MRLAGSVLRPLVAVLSLAGVGLVSLCPRDAAACMTCAADADCPRGFACNTSFHGCMPPGCQADADCAAGMRCVTGVASLCTGNTCGSANACAPVWQAGCNVDADCGAGFKCVANGSMCDPSGCTTVAQCQTTLEVPCQADADCPACWSCTDEPGTACINPGGPAFPVDAGAQPRTCRPPYWGLSVGYAGPGPAAGTPPPAAACGGTPAAGSGGPDTTLTGMACAMGAAGCAGSWLGFAALAGAGIWSARRRGRRTHRAG